VATVAAVRVERGTVEEAIDTFGTVEFDPHETRTVSFVKSGRVLQVLVTPGQPIVKGGALLQLGPLPSSSLEVQQARINLEFAKENLARLQRLLGSHLATNEAVQRAKMEVATAGARLASLGVDGSPEPDTIPSPFSGVVVKVLVTSGTIVHSGEDAMLVAPSNGLAVRAGFEPEDAARLEPGMKVMIEPVFRGEGEPGVAASLSQLHRVVDPSTQLVETLIRPSTIPSWMVAGSDVRIHVVLRTARDAVRIPRAALLDRSGRAGVFVISGGHARWTPVELGVTADRWVEVRRGVHAGDVVATTGRSSLSDGMAVAATLPKGAG